MKFELSEFEVKETVGKIPHSRDLKDEICFTIRENGLTVKQAVALLESVKTELFDRKFN